jgi:uncharacterized membrane protein YadS
MEFARKNGKGLLLCLAIALPAWLLVKYIPALSVVGAPVIAILAGMLIAVFLKDQTPYKSGVTFTSKKILQTPWCCWASVWTLPPSARWARPPCR